MRSWNIAEMPPCKDGLDRVVEDSEREGAGHQNWPSQASCDCGHVALLLSEVVSPRENLFRPSSSDAVKNASTRVKGEGVVPPASRADRVPFQAEVLIQEQP